MQATVLLPALPRIADSAFVSRWRRYGDAFAPVSPGRDCMLRECFAFLGDRIPVAALTRDLDAHDAGDALWLRADPAFVMADAVTLRLMACGELGLLPEEIDAFVRILKPLFGDAGFEFSAPNPVRWYLRCKPGAPLPTFSAPDDALGDDLANHLPAGQDASRWRALLNEAQIVLTQHPLNAQRVRRGLPPVNSLWFWGAGTLPSEVRSKFDSVVSDDAVVVALAGLAKLPSFPRSRESSFFFSCFSGKQKQELDSRLRGNDERKKILVDLADQRDVTTLDDDWFAPLDAELKSKRLAQLDLRFESGERCTVKSAHRWRFWRRSGAGK
jgi:hypothetical protein